MARPLSLGARQLAAKGSQTELSEKLGVTQQAISGWLTGRCRPNGEHLLKIKRTFGIEIADWYRTSRQRQQRTPPAATGTDG